MKTQIDLWRPFSEFNRLQRQVERLFDQTMAPAYEVDETESHYLMSFDLPGVPKEDIRINLQDNTLTVSGARKEEREEKGKDYYQTERSYGSYERSFTLPAGIKAEQIEADYRNGVLRVAVPKGEASKGQQIKIGEGKAGFWDRLLSHKKEESRTPQKEREKERVA